jgi:Uma2 family endonuclease
VKTLAKWSVEDYHRLIEAGIVCDRRVELLAGEIVQMSPASPRHYSLAESRADALKTLLSGKAHVRFDGPVTLADSEPEPDIAIVRLPQDRYWTSHPTPEDIFWLIEFSQSTLDYDLNEKKQAYARAGIPEYWVVAVKERQVHVCRHPQGSDYQFQTIFRQGMLNPLSFSDVSISVEFLARSQP